MFTFPDQPGYSFLSQAMPSRRAMNYWLFYHVNRHLGRSVLEMTGTAPYHEGTLGGHRYRGPLTPAVVTMAGGWPTALRDHRQRSWTAPFPVTSSWRTSSAGGAATALLSHSDPAAYPFLERKDDLRRRVPVRVASDRLTMDLPPHSVVFVTIEAL